MKPIIEVTNLSKKFIITRAKDNAASYSTLRDDITSAIKRGLAIFSGRGSRGSLGGREEFWALSDVNFTVERGEVLGIIGANGAGKSTLLKILTRITPPTKGQAIVRGSVGSLLEVGTGFHTELTGRENIFLNGSILGMKRKEIERKFDEIVDFAGVRKFLDIPVKRYSSGMSVRLAFSVAAHLEPDILLIDEVLAVGDAAFQKKSFNKMEDITKNGDRTILFVSHNMQVVKDLCRRSILLDRGRVVMIGATHEVINRYLEGKTRQAQETFPMDLRQLPRKSGGGDFKLTVLNVAGPIATGRDLTLKVGFERSSAQPLDDVVLSVEWINDRHEICCLLRNDVYGKLFSIHSRKGEFTVTVPRLPLGGGSYSIQLAVFSYRGRAQQGVHDWIEHGIDMHVNQGDFYGTGHAGFPECASVFVDSKFEIHNS